MRHLREKKTRRGPPAALLGAGVWRHAWGYGAHCPSTAHHAAFNGRIYAGSLSKVMNLENLLWGKLAPPPPRSQSDARNFVLAQKFFINIPSSALLLK
jgi:hypothetical protein